MPAERRNFNNFLEPLIYWDATFAIAFFEEDAQFHIQCEDFERRLRGEGTLSLSSDFTYNELAFHRKTKSSVNEVNILKSALTLEGERTGRHWLDVKRENPELLLATMPTVEARLAEIVRLTLQLPVGEGVRPRAFALMREYPLLPTDAYHIAAALKSDVTTFATLDTDFLQVDGIVVYTCIS